MRYKALNAHLKQLFGHKVYKISLDIGGTCPNRDGSKGKNGCIFCNPSQNRAASLDVDGTSIGEQIKSGKEYIKKRHHAEKFISYFQQHSNTYGDIGQLKEQYYESINDPDIVGTAISTRPDCISDAMLDLLSEINKVTYLWIELGLQTANDEILTSLNRGHTLQDFIDCTNRLHERSIQVVAHIILGLPEENDELILKNAELINKLGIEGIKIHNLHVLKFTKLEEMYNSGRIELISLEEYARKVVLLLEHLDPRVLIHRFNSHAPKRLTVAPAWSINKLATFNEVEKELERKDTWQGKYFS